MTRFRKSENATSRSPYFGPRIDDDLLPTDIGHLILGAPQKPTLLGLVEEESAFFSNPSNFLFFKKPNKYTLAVFPPHAIGRLLAIPPEKQDTFGPQDIKEFVMKAVGIDESYVEYARREILHFYLTPDNASQINDYAFYVKRYTEVRERLATFRYVVR